MPQDFITSGSGSGNAFEVRWSDKVFDDLQLALTLFGDRIVPYVREGVNRSLGRFRKRWVAEMRSRYPGKSGYGFASSRVGDSVPSGRLKGLWFYRRSTDDQTTVDDIAGFFYTRSKVAAAHEFGATIRPTGGKKMLAIPVSKSIDPRLYTATGKLKKGSSRPGLKRSYGKRAFTFGLSDKGTPMLFRRRDPSTKKPATSPSYYLKRMQVIKPTLGLHSNWRSYQRNVTTIMRAEISKGMADIFFFRDPPKKFKPKRRC